MFPLQLVGKKRAETLEILFFNTLSLLCYLVNGINTTYLFLLITSKAVGTFQHLNV